VTSSLRLAAILISSRPIMLSHTVLESIGHFTPELLISALCDVTINNLAYLTVSVLPSWPVWKFLLLVYFFRLGLKVCLCQAVALRCMLHCEHFGYPAPFIDQLNRLYFPLSAAHRFSDSNISGSNPSALSQRFLEQTFTLKFMTDGFELSATEGYQSFCLINKW